MNFRELTFGAWPIVMTIVTAIIIISVTIYIKRKNV